MSEFVSLDDLLYGERDYSVGDLATGVETQGIWGWDEFGRCRCFKLEDPVAQRVMKALAFEYRVQQGEVKRAGDDDGEFFRMHGWPGDQLPSKDDSPLVKKPRKQAETRTRNADLRLIAAQMKLLLGQLGNYGRHPKCPDEAALLRIIEEQAPEAGEGLGRETVRPKFREAEDQWGRV